MEITSFEAERFFPRHEFTAPHLLCASDCAVALASQGVLLFPGACLGSDDRHFRLGLARTSFPTALAQLGAFLERDPTRC